MDDLAICGGVPYKTKPFPKWPVYDNREIDLVVDVVKSQNWWRITGTKVNEFEKKFAEFQQCKYCFDVCFQEDSASVLINSCEQMITEKLKSLMRFGTRSTRYKDVFDICYLSDLADMEKLRFCIQKYIYADTTIDVNDADEIRRRSERIFTSSAYKKQMERSKKNWLDLSVAPSKSWKMFQEAFSFGTQILKICNDTH